MPPAAGTTSRQPPEPRCAPPPPRTAGRIANRQHQRGAGVRGCRTPQSRLRERQRLLLCRLRLFRLRSASSPRPRRAHPLLILNPPTAAGSPSPRPRRRRRRRWRRRRRRGAGAVRGVGVALKRLFVGCDAWPAGIGNEQWSAAIGGRLLGLKVLRPEEADRLTLEWAHQCDLTEVPNVQQHSSIVPRGKHDYIHVRQSWIEHWYILVTFWYPLSQYTGTRCNRCLIMPGSCSILLLDWDV